MFVPDNYIKRTSSTIPFGYELDENFDGYLKPNQDDLDILQESTIGGGVGTRIDDGLWSMCVLGDLS